MHLIDRRGLFLTVAFVIAASAAQAQAPQRSTATYEDWTLRCEATAGTPPQKYCEIVQSTQRQGQSNPVTQIAIGRPAKTAPFKTVVLVPVNVWLPAGIKLVYDEKQASFNEAFNRCLPGGCFAEGELTDDILKRLRARTDRGRLEFKDANQNDITTPVSFKGFSQALDALLKD